MTELKEIDRRIPIEKLSRKRQLAIRRREAKAQNKKAVIYNGEIIVRNRVDSKIGRGNYKHYKTSKIGSSKSIYKQIISKLVTIVIPEQTVKVKNMKTRKLNKAYDLDQDVKIVKKQIVISHITSSFVSNYDRNKRRKKNQQARKMRVINR